VLSRARKPEDADLPDLHLHPPQRRYERPVGGDRQGKLACDRPLAYFGEIGTGSGGIRTPFRGIRTGRRGALSYEFERSGSRTVLTRSSCTTPWHHFPPSCLDDSGCAYTWLVNPSGGLVGGDQGWRRASCAAICFSLGRA
jgi:hypothetical protein